MNFSLFMILIDSLVIIGALLSIIYTLGVVWRVEKKLDTSYKFFLVAIIAFTASEVFAIYSTVRPGTIQVIALTCKAVFVIFFLMGILEMRKIVRNIDGEK
jgi:hypothetical protein